jgi:hypothetical protein
LQNWFLILSADDSALLFEYGRMKHGTWLYLLETNGWKINALGNELQDFRSFVRLVRPIGLPPAIDKRKSKRPGFVPIMQESPGSSTPRRLFAL